MLFRSSGRYLGEALPMRSSFSRIRGALMAAGGAFFWVPQGNLAFGKLYVKK